MNMERKKPRYLVTKRVNGKDIYYWQPSTALHKLGFRVHRLSDNVDDARKEAEKLNNEVDEVRQREKLKPSLSSEPTLEEVIELYKRSSKFISKAASTQRSYDQNLKHIETWAGSKPIASIPRSSILEYLEEFRKKRHASSNAVGRMIGIVFEFAYDQGIIPANIARKLKLPKLPPRHAFFTLDDQNAFVAAAIEAKKPSMALALLLGVCTAQREGDILPLTWHQYDGIAIRLRQRKTKRWVSIPALPELKAALDRAKTLNLGKNKDERCEFIVVNERTKTNYKDDNFRHVFRKIANSAGLNHLQFRDLRRTAVVRFAEAGLSNGRITAISGHDVAHCEAILEVYMPRTSQMAEEGIQQYEEFRSRQKKAESEEQAESGRTPNLRKVGDSGDQEHT